MASSRDNDRPRPAPAKTPEAREQQMVSLAFDLAEKQLRDGSAPAQTVTHYLKLGTVRESLEREKIIYETELLKTKKESIDSMAKQEVLFEQAIAAMKSYQGQDDRPLDD